MSFFVSSAEKRLVFSLYLQRKSPPGMTGFIIVMIEIKDEYNRNLDFGNQLKLLNHLLQMKHQG